jgi:CRP-like cAMP-binding protein
MYFINSGAVQIRLDQPDMPPKTIKVITTGSFFGEGALFSKTTRSASAIAEVRTQCLALDAESFERLVDENEEFGRRMRIIATRRVTRINKEMGSGGPEKHREKKLESRRDSHLNLPPRKRQDLTIETEEHTGSHMKCVV